MKRHISFLIALAMIISMFSSFVTVHAAAPTFTDVEESTKYRNAIITLSKIGLVNGEKLDDGTYIFRPDSSVTRAEFTAMIVRALGMGNVATTADKFSDVSGHWAEGNISVASSRGIILGFEDGTFRPDDEVTYEQAVKMIVCTLGYEAQAVTMGGWPNGYMSEGSALGINESVSGVAQEAAAPRGVIAQIIYNMLDVKVQDIKNAEDSLQNNKDKETFMQRYLNLEYEKGKIIGVETNVTNDIKELGKFQMAAVVDGEVIYLDFRDYTSNPADLSQYLGQTVNLFYKTDVVGADYTLIDVDADTTKNTITTVSYDKLYKADDTTIQYFDNADKVKTIKLAKDVSIIYNGTLVSKDAIDLSELLTDGEPYFIYGEIKATDSGSTGSVDVLEITDYDIIVSSKTVSSSNYEVTNKLKFAKEEYKSKYDLLSAVTLDPEDPTVELSIKKGSTKMEPTSIKANDVLLYACNIDETKMNVLVSSTTVSGSVTAWDPEDQEVTINGKKYKVHDVCLDYLAENGSELKVSASVTLYLDAFDTAVYATITANQTVSPYGYITSAYEDDEETCYMQAFMPGTGYKTYQMKDKVQINGKSFPGTAAVSELKKLSKEQDNFGDEHVAGYEEAKTSSSSACQIARITLANGMVSQVVTQDATALEEKVTDTSGLVKFSKCESLKYIGSKTFRKGSSQTRYTYDSNTVVIYIPQDRTDTTAYAKKATSAFTSNKDYVLEAYNVNDKGVASLLLMYGGSGSTTEIDYTTPIMLENKAISTKVVDGERLSVLNVFNSSLTSTEIIESSSVDSDWEDPKPGDAIQVGYDAQSQAKKNNIIIRAKGVYVDDEYIPGIMDVIEESVTAIDDGDDEAVVFNWNPGGKVDQLNRKAYALPFYFQPKENYNSIYSYTRCFVANVYDIDTEDEAAITMQVTIDGLKLDEDGNYAIVSEDFLETIDVPANTPIYRYDSSSNKVTTENAKGNTIEINDLQGARYVGEECSHVMLYLYPGNKLKFICLYE